MEVIPHWTPQFHLPGRLCLLLASKPVSLPCQHARKPWIAAFSPSLLTNAKARVPGCALTAAMAGLGGNMSSILKFAPHGEGILLTTLWKAKPGGDQGVYWVSRRLPVRLPLDETIWVWPEDGALAARHDMWLCGVRYLRLRYRLLRRF
ncbi:MAG: hypothetical protein JNL62_26310 [Bryobacterales bacterium]|nr:hypothetical protein [Bryobacterales bacterium]